MGARLEGEGWTVLARNWRGGGGELDVVVQRGDALRFVEVKARDEEDPSGFEAITEDKQRRLVSAAEAWLVEHAPKGEVCFMAALVTLRAGEEYSIEFLDDAFDG